MNKFYRLILLLCLLPFFIAGVTDAATWVEDFNNSSLSSWVKHDQFEKSTWQPVEGKLDVWVQPPPPPGIFDLYALQFVGFEFDVDELNVQLNVLQARNTNVGILIGTNDWTREIYETTITFFHTDFHGKNVLIPEDFEILERDRNVIPIPVQPNTLEISFHRGDFEVLIDKVFYAKYHVPQLKTINCVGITSMVGLGRGVIAHFVLDDFVVSGPDVPEKGILNVRSKNKAAVLWGQLKQKFE